jgi:AcrR family transcriptional regulator
MATSKRRGRTPTRSDSLVRRKALLDAAWEVFDDLGIGAPLDQIAKRAGLANATLYRHFRNREELVAETFAEEVATTAERIGQVTSLDDPWEAFEGLLETVFEMQARNLGYGQAMSMSFPEMKPLFGARSRTTRQTREVIARAEAAGALRKGFSLTDLPPLLWANSAILEGTREQAPEAWRRYLRLTLDGLGTKRADAPLPPPMTTAQSRESMSRLGRELLG